MALVDEHQRVVRHIFEQRRRRLARFAAGEIARIVLDAGAGAGRFHHFQIVDRALLEPLRFEQAAGGIELVEALAQLHLDAGDRLQQCRPRRHIVRVGVDFDEFQLVGLLAGERIELLDRFDFVAEQRHAPGAILIVRGENLDRIAADPERAAIEIAGGALVLQCDQVGQQCALIEPLALLERERHRRISLDRADAVDAGHRSDDDHIVALEQRARRRMAHAVDLLVDRGILLDIGVGARDIGFRLVVIVIADEIFDRVVGKEALELAVELRRQRLVRRQDQRRALRLLDHLRHGESLARAGDAEQHLAAVVTADAFDQIGDGPRLVALRIEIGLDDQPPAAFALFRPLRPVRHPDFVGAAVVLAEFRPAFAQQPVEGLLAGEARNRADFAAARSLQAQPRRPHVGRDHVLRVFLRGAALVVSDAERAGEIGIELTGRHRCLADIALLRCFAEAARHRGARPVRLGEVGAAIEGIVGRLCQFRRRRFGCAFLSPTGPRSRAPECVLVGEGLGVGVGR